MLKDELALVMAHKNFSLFFPVQAHVTQFVSHEVCFVMNELAHERVDEDEILFEIAQTELVGL